MENKLYKVRIFNEAFQEKPDNEFILKLTIERMIINIEQKHVKLYMGDEIFDLEINKPFNLFGLESRIRDMYMFNNTTLIVRLLRPYARLKFELL
jgi:hypothetical protein